MLVERNGYKERVTVGMWIKMIEGGGIDRKWTWLGRELRWDASEKVRERDIINSIIEVWMGRKNRYELIK